MRVDIHAHFFTFQLFLTAAAEANLQSRLVRDTHMSPAAAKTVVTLLKALVASEVEHSPLWTMLRKFGLVDVFGEKFVKIGCLPSISAVADAFFDIMAGESKVRGYVAWPPEKTDAAEELLVTALMMDVVDGKSSDEDLAKYPVQYRDTVLQAIRYPGRVLPFAAFNPLRRGNNSLTNVKYALKSGECVGVKLYPSLGYDSKHEMVKELMATCAAYDAPIVMHCNDGGFFGPEDYDPDKCFPQDWGDLAVDYGVRIDFAHFGEQNRRKEYHDVWRNCICKLLKEHPEFCYTDLSYQAHVVRKTAHSEDYENWLRQVMLTSEGRNVLFGTDFYMSCMETDVTTYWATMADILGADFDRASRENALHFLGFDAKTGRGGVMLPRPGSSLERHGGYLAGKQDGNPSFGEGAAPASWLTRLWAERPLPRP